MLLTTETFSSVYLNSITSLSPLLLPFSPLSFFLRMDKNTVQEGDGPGCSSSYFPRMEAEEWNRLLMVLFVHLSFFKMDYMEHRVILQFWKQDLIKKILAQECLQKLG